MVYNLTIISLFYPYKQKTYTNDIYNIVYIYVFHMLHGIFTYITGLLVGGLPTPSEKYESMGRIIPYMKWTKKMFETTNQINSLTWTKVIFRMLPFKSSFSHDFYGGFTPVLPIFFLVPRCFNSQVRCRSSRSPQQPRHFPDWQRGAGCWDHWGPVLTIFKKHGMLLKWFSGNSLYITHIYIMLYYAVVYIYIYIIILKIICI